MRICIGETAAEYCATDRKSRQCLSAIMRNIGRQLPLSASSTMIY